MDSRFTKKQDKDSLLQLLFLINPVTKEIIFSNQPLGFIEPTTASGIPSFIRFDESQDASTVQNDWDKCLQLQTGQTRRFSANLQTDTGPPVAVVIDAAGVAMSGSPVTSILFTIEQAYPDADKGKRQFEELNSVLNAYKKEYINFINIASHDLDAPLRKLTTFIERLILKLKSGAGYDEVAEYIPRLQSSLNEMRSLIDDLSVLSGIISSIREYEECNMETIIREVIAGMQPLIKEKKAEITISMLPVIAGDPDQFSRLFRNLIDNAIKFSKQDLTPVINIQSSELTHNEKKYWGLKNNVTYYKLTITDNGVGFKQEFAEKIFQPFQRLHGKSQFRGNGIGLAICKKITENHKGIIFAESGENSGACFTLILPQTIPPIC